ncbi:MAG: tetratricopeptide repeat protein [Acidobacteria bacterium]|nr:tetratricopeptide repeat protein [Acidobacteriota bacterium]
MNGSSGSELYRVGDLVLDVDACLLTRNGEVVALPPKTFDLLVELVRHAPGVVRREELIELVWPNEIVNDEALTQRVMLLRRALGDHAKDPTFIASAPRWGYRLVAPVERAATGDAASRAPPDGDVEGVSLSGLQQTIVTVRRRDRWIITGVLTLALILVGVALWPRIGWGRHPIDSLAITPFVASDTSNDTEILSEGIPATLTATMARAPNLRVIAASTMVRYRGTAIDPQHIGRVLGVRAVLTGKLMRHGALVVIDTELVDVKDGSRLWGARLESPLTDIFAVQSEISSEIASGMRLRLTGAQRTRLATHTTSNVGAYTLYLKGRHFWNKRDETGFDEAIASFRKAIDLDPSYALAYVGLADCFALEASMEYGLAAPVDMMPKARSAAVKALELDPDLAEAHASLGLVLWIYDWKRERAEHELRRAIELSPGYATAHQWLAEMLAEDGMADQAESEIRVAEQLDPLSLVISADRGLLPYYRQDYELAIHRYRATLAMDPAFLQARLGLGLAYLHGGERDMGLEVLREANQMAGGAPPTLSAVGYAYGLAGKTAEARAVLEKLLELRKERYISAFYVAGVYIGLGDKDSAFTWLDRACTERASLLRAIKVWPEFDPLRSDPRYAALLRCLHLQ